MAHVGPSRRNGHRDFIAIVASLGETRLKISRKVSAIGRSLARSAQVSEENATGEIGVRFTGSGGIDSHVLRHAVFQRTR